MKFLIDMNLSPAWIGFLIEAGFEAVHWSTIGPGDAEDGEVMRWAAEHDHVVLTSDLDFGAILAAAHGRRPSVVQLRGDVPTPGVMGRVVLSAVGQVRDHLVNGALVSIDLGRTRLRLLPLNDQ
jgi:predicted nuclease of predicted toxin-antitoxin system